MASYTFTLTGNSSNLSSSIFPEVELDKRADYSCALLELTTYHTIPNVTKSNNRVLYYWTSEKKPANGAKDGVLTEFQVPPGCYEAKEILDYIKNQFKGLGLTFEYTINKNTFRTSIKCTTTLYTGAENSGCIFQEIFGFAEERLLTKNSTSTSNDIVKIASKDIVRVECSIASGSYVNGKHSHAIYEFATNRVDVGYKIIERPRNLIYLPVTVRKLNRIDISLVDQNGSPIDFCGETITCRIHIKKE